MSRTLAVLAVAAAALAAPFASHADTVEQAPAHNHYYDQLGGATTADEFWVAEDTAIAQVSWWGGYYPDGIAPDADNFIIRFYANDLGQPGQLLQTYEVGNDTRRQATGASFGGSLPEFLYIVDLPQPLTVQTAPGAIYWIEIVNTSSTSWVWEWAGPVGGPHVARSTRFGGWQLQSGSMALRLSDTTLVCTAATGLQPPGREEARPSDPVFSLADDFVLPVRGAATKLTWWGGYEYNDPGPDVVPDAFEITFYDDAGGRPGAILASYGNQREVVRTRSGCSVRRKRLGAQAEPEYRYEAPLPPGLALEPGRRYWLSIRNRSAWLWELSNEPQTPGMMWAFFGNWQPIQESVAFDLGIEIAGLPEGCTFPGNEQPPAHSMLLVGQTGGQVAADDFVVPQTAQLMRVEWWGGTAFQPPVAEDFTVSIFADAGGRPGSLTASYRPGLAVTKEPTGEMLPGAGSPEYLYRFQLPAPLPLARNTRYWLSVSAHPSDYFAWETSTTAGGQSLHFTYSAEQGPWFPTAPPENAAAFRVVTVGPSCVSHDADGDGIDDVEDADPSNPLVCADTDFDSCDDCASGSFSTTADGPDADGDAVCDATDPDDDNDRIGDGADNCPFVYNPTQEDLDGDFVGSVCDGPHSPLCAGADQPPAHTAAVDSPNYNHTPADDFIAERDSYLMRLVWWGGFRFSQEGEYLPPESFILRIYDDAGGVPGALRQEFSPGVDVVAKHGTGDPLIDVPPPAPPEYRYTFELPAPLRLAAGRYWLAIGAGEAFHRWSWSASAEALDAPPMDGIRDEISPPFWSPIEGVNGLAFTAVLAGGACAADTDGDGIVDGEDQPDADFDGVADAVDNCPLVPNPSQDDEDGDGTGSLCDGPHSQTCTAGSEQAPGHTGAHSTDGRSATIADNVHLGRRASLMRLQWWGGLYEAAGDRLIERFLIRFYQDRDGMPETLLSTLLPGRKVQKEPTGEMLGPDLPFPEYRYTLTLVAPPALVDGRYWISIGAEAPQPWLWSTSDAPGLPGLAASSGTPEDGPWITIPGGENMALLATVAGEVCAADSDMDGLFDGEDVAPHDPLGCIDTDADLCDDCSSGVRNPAADGADLDADGLCDRGDPDDDADGAADAADNCALVPNPSQADFDHDGIGDDCDNDDDGDGAVDTADNCLLLPNPGQADFDRDGLGDDCDADDDGDAVADDADLCTASVMPETAVPTVALVEGRYALIDGDGVFDTVGATGEVFTFAQTRGCTCAQVIARSSGEKDGHYKHGCSAELIRGFVEAHP